ncbi:hypothetical protein DIZ76_011245 [Coccidioides immitis]|nr:hypothetical protein DIZ76_011245 [Coccidioides immitis]
MKWTFLSGIFIFELGSVICATAISSILLIVGRAIAGIGAAALFSGGLNIVAETVPLRKRAPYIALLSSMMAVSNIIGPPLGGIITNRLGWRWCFWVNLPCGGAAFVVGLIFLKEMAPPSAGLSITNRLVELDLLGAVLLLGGITSFVLAIEWAGKVYPCHVFYLPIYFQAVKGSSPEKSGLDVVPYQASNAGTSLIVGLLVGMVGWYVPFVWFGALAFAIGSSLLYTVGPNSYTATLIVYQFITGVGMGASVQIPYIAAQVVSNRDDISSADAIMIFFHSIGGTLSLAIGGNVFTGSLQRILPVEAPLVNSTVVINVGPTNLRIAVPPDQLGRVLKAYTTSLTTTFISPIVTSSVAILCSLLLEQRSVKGTNLLTGTSSTN